MLTDLRNTWNVKPNALERQLYRKIYVPTA